MVLKVKQYIVIVLVVVLTIQPSLFSVAEVYLDEHQVNEVFLKADTLKGCADDGCCSTPAEQSCCSPDNSEISKSAFTTSNSTGECFETSEEDCCNSSGEQPCECNQCPCAQNTTAYSGRIVDDSQSSPAPSVELISPVQFGFPLSEYSDTPYRPPVVF